jgi:hypothetical protein
MISIGIANALVLLGIAILHAAWAMGSEFPATDEKALSRMVTGFKGQDEMPPRTASAMVAVALAGASFWCLALSGLAPIHLPSWLVVLGGIALALVFGARGIAGYTAWWQELTPEQPFRRLDIRLYSPLCLLIGAAFILLLTGMTT